MRDTTRRTAARTLTTAAMAAASITGLTLAGPGGTLVPPPAAAAPASPAAVAAPASPAAASRWSPPSTLELVGIFSRGPVVTLSADGTRALAVWFANGPGDPVMRAATASLSDGRGTWSTPVTISAPSDIRPLDDPAVRMTADGRQVIVAWTRDNGSGLQDVELVTGEWGDRGLVWGDPQVMSVPGHDTSSPMLGMAADGSRVLLAWRDRASRVTIVARTATVATGALTWSPPTTVSATTACRRFLPRADPSADGGTLAATWEERCGDRRAIMTATGTWPAGADALWTAPRHISPQSPDSRGPQLGVGSGGTVLVVWRQLSTQGKRAVVASLGTVTDGGTTWQRAQQVSNPKAGADNPDLAMSPDGRVAVAVWSQGGLKRGQAWATTARIDAGAITWQRAEQVSRPDEWTFHPDVAISDDGRRVAATWYQGGPTDRDLIWAVSGRVAARTTWSAPVALSRPGESAFLPTIDLCDTGANAIVGWSRQSPEETYGQDVQVATR